MTDTAAAGFDLANLDLGKSADQGATMQLLHPVSGEPLGISFEVLGQDGASYRKNLRKLRDLIAKQGDDDDEDPDTRDLTRLARLAGCSVRNWAGVEWEGAALAYSFDNAVMLFTARPWVAEQVAFFRDRRANFFKESPPSSEKPSES